MRIDPSNVEMLRYWDGDRGGYWAEHAERFDEGAARYNDHLLKAAAIEADASVLDVGCGAGRTTRDAARAASAGSALGVDLSARQVELASRLAEREGVPNVRFLQADAQLYPFGDNHFDVIVSRHGVMFFGDPPAAFANLARALRPGGRMVLLSWQADERNEWMSAFRTALAAGRELPAPPPAAPGWLEDPDQTRELLTAAGLRDVRVDGLTEPMYFGPDADDACRFVSGQLAWRIADLDADGRARALDDLRASMADHETEQGVLYQSAAWLIQARRG